MYLNVRNNADDEFNVGLHSTILTDMRRVESVVPVCGKHTAPQTGMCVCVCVERRSVLYRICQINCNAKLQFI